MITLLQAAGGIDPGALVSSLCDKLGMDMFEEEIDNVIFQTNEFLTDATFIGAQGPFWWILEMCMALAATFSIIMAGGMAYKMMVKGEAFDVMKILRVLGVSIVMFCWYPGGLAGEGSILGMLAYIPNCIGSYTHDLYEAEAYQVQEKFDALTPLLEQRDSLVAKARAEASLAKGSVSSLENQAAIADGYGSNNVVSQAKDASLIDINSTYTGLMVCLDKIVMWLSMIIFRIGWWGTIYVQQILLGMLTIFGPLQWAFSILPKWEGAWAKWITRYLTVHFFGAMLYFVGFYVLLLFDIVLSIQYENLAEIVGFNDPVSATEKFNFYLQNAFMTAGYLLVASVVSLQCLNLVPDLAAWMIPEGDAIFSTRQFGQGVASGVKSSATGLVGKMF